MKKGQVLKEEGNALVKKGEHKKAIEKYSESLKHNPTEVTTYTNRWASSLFIHPYFNALLNDGRAVDWMFEVSFF